MSDFEREVTIKLRRRMRLVSEEVDGKLHNNMVPCESVEVYRPPKRKPVAILTGASRGSRAELLRTFADWVEQQDDDELLKLEETMKEKIG